MKYNQVYGFTLIELLVVVAILGIISAIGITSYNGYVAGAKKKSTQNVMQQVSLGQTEYFSEMGEYFTQNTSECVPTEATSDELESKLLGNADVINKELGYFLCSYVDGTKFKIVALEDVTSNKCKFDMSWNGTFGTPGSHC